MRESTTRFPRWRQKGQRICLSYLRCSRGAYRWCGGPDAISALRLRRSCGAWDGWRSRVETGMRSALVRLDIPDDVFDRADFLGVLIRDFHPVFLLERHHELNDVERVGAEIFDKRGLRRNFVGGDAKLLADNFTDLRFHLCSSHHDLRPALGACRCIAQLRDLKPFKQVRGPKLSIAPPTGSATSIGIPLCG